MVLASILALPAIILIAIAATVITLKTSNKKDRQRESLAHRSYFPRDTFAPGK